MKDIKLYLLHIQESIQRIEAYAIGGEKGFLASTLVQDAILRNLQVMAESTQRLPDDWKAQYPQIAWREIAGFRNKLVHDYLGVNPYRVWLILEKDLPLLKAVIALMLEKYDSEL